MNDESLSLLEALNRGLLSRRQLLHALGGLALVPASALAASAPRSAKRGWYGAPPKLPFKSTGWKTVLLDHLSFKVKDYEKEAAYYSALMNWAVRSDDGRETLLDIGDWGGILIRGGYEPPASEVAAARAQYERRAALARAKGRQIGPYVPRNAVVDSICWGIEPWDTRKVEATLKARGLNPVPDNHGNDFESFHVKDPDGFDVQISNGNRLNRRTTPARGHLAVAAPFAHTDWKTVYLDHLSYQCSNYRRSVAFYQALLGWEPWFDFNNQNQIRIGNFGDTYIHGYVDGGGHGVLIDHISFGIAPFNPEAVKAALVQRGLPASPDGPLPLETAPYKSYHTTTPNGYDLQISNADPVNRGEMGE